MTRPLQLERPSSFKKKRHSPLMRLRIRNRVRKAIRGDRHSAALLRQFGETLQGTYPCENAPGVIVAACNDYYYWHFAESFIRSIERHGVGEHVHLHLCDPSERTLADIGRIAGRLDSVHLTWTFDRGGVAAGLEFETIYFAAVRFLVASVVQERAPVPVLCLDIDGIAIAPVWPAYREICGGADTLLILRPERTRAWRKILACAVGFNPTPNGLKFSRAVARAILSTFELRPRYHVDQIVIHYVMSHMVSQHALTVGDMPSRFADFEFVPDAVIWTAKGWQRKDSEVYAAAVRDLESAART